jgi:hypothetical protein
VKKCHVFYRIEGSCRLHKSPPSNRKNLVHIVTPYFFQITCNIFFQSVFLPSGISPSKISDSTLNSLMTGYSLIEITVCNKHLLE